MVVSTASQLPATYRLWRRFNFPTEDGSVPAVAVPNWVANQLNAAYSTMIAMMMVHFWSIVIGIVVYLILRRNKLKPHGLHPLAPTLWNKRSDLLDSMIETFMYTKDDWGRLWLYCLFVLILAAWVGQTIMGIVVPPLIIAGNAAPVDASVIYIPDDQNNDAPVLATRFALEVPWALRALGSANVAIEDVSKKVRVSRPIQMGKRDNGEDIQRIDYGYRVTGADFGLQKHTDLILDVTGACITEYGWLKSSGITLSGSTRVAIDSYQVFDEPTLVQVSLFQGPQPVASFHLGSLTKGTLDTSNNTWAMVVSSVNRTSFSPGSDPLYLTGPGASGDAYSIKPARPVLSCWQDDVWSYQGHNSTVDALMADAFPSLALPQGLQNIFIRYLGEPMIRQVGARLASSALLSATTSTGQIFDAASSSMYNDLRRLVLASFIATTNILTDSTLYPDGAERQVPNAALDDSGQLFDGLADFVVWTPNVSALSLTVVIAIPTALVFVWLLAILLLYWTPVRLVNALDSNDMYQKLTDNHQHATLIYDKKDGATWNLNSTTDPVPEPQLTETVPPSTFEASGENKKGNQQVVSTTLPKTMATGKASNV